MAADQIPKIHHATTVSISGHGVLILGPSGSGKSALALELISCGAALVADDRTVILRDEDKLLASPPATIAGQIEARGVGLITMPHEVCVPLRLAVDLGQEETERLPRPHRLSLLGIDLPRLHRAPGPHFAAAVLLCAQYSLNRPL